jgi:hypothetical protein
MRIFVLPLALSALALGGCATNYAGEGALGGGLAGALIGAGSGDAVGGAVIGAALGGAGGSLVKKHHGCYRYNRNGHRYWSRHC